MVPEDFVAEQLNSVLSDMHVDVVSQNSSTECYSYCFQLIFLFLAFMIQETLKKITPIIPQESGKPSHKIFCLCTLKTISKLIGCWV